MRTSSSFQEWEIGENEGRGNGLPGTGFHLTLLACFALKKNEKIWIVKKR